MDEKGRKGIFLPAQMYRDFEFFDTARYQVGDQDFSYKRVMSDYWRLATESPHAMSFVVYNGSEVYSPAPYLPYVAAAIIARHAHFNFLGTLYLMRVAGFIAMTAVVAYAISIVPRLGWAFFCIALLPAALYGRCVVSADGGALSYAMMITALCTRAAQSSDLGKPYERSLWMSLCVLTKWPNMAFIALEIMRRPIRDLPRVWLTVSLVVMPGIILALVWLAASSGDVATWRLTEGSDLARHQFDAIWKLRFMLENPLHFPTMLIGNVQDAFELWRQFIGILGWLDTALHPWTYPAASVLLLSTLLVPLKSDFKTRRRLALFACVSVLGYCFAVFLIFYLVWTPTDSFHVEGVQGRYFIVVLPPIAVMIAAIMHRGLRQPLPTLAALAGAILSGGATIEAILRNDWKIW
jgi:uncharacterized membrane protein